MDSISPIRVTLDGMDLVLKKPSDNKTIISELRCVSKLEAERNRKKPDQESDNSFQGSEGEDMGRDAARVDLEGEIMGEHAEDAIGQLREKHLKGLPLELVSSVSLSSSIRMVMIEELTIASVKGTPHRYQYSLKLVEYTDL